MARLEGRDAKDAGSDMRSRGLSRTGDLNERLEKHVKAVVNGSERQWKSSNRMTFCFSHKMAVFVGLSVLSTGW